MRTIGFPISHKENENRRAIVPAHIPQITHPECLYIEKGYGHVLGIFPEGTRHKEGVMQEMESGASMIALRSRARLLPAYIASKPRVFRTTHVYFHEPVSIADIAAKGVNKDTCNEVSERIAAVYAEMVAQHERNVG